MTFALYPLALTPQKAKAICLNFYLNTFAFDYCLNFYPNTFASLAFYLRPLLTLLLSYGQQAKVASLYFKVKVKTIVKSKGRFHCQCNSQCNSHCYRYHDHHGNDGGSGKSCAPALAAIATAIATVIVTTITTANSQW